MKLHLRLLQFIEKALFFCLPVVLYAFISGPPDASGQSPSINSLHAMPTDQFFQLERVQAQMAEGRIDQELLSAAVFHETNQRRIAEGLDRLEHDARLDEAALMHARDMAEGRYLSHTNPDEPSLRTPTDRVRAAGLDPRYVAENVATHFGIQYNAGERVFAIRRGGKTLYLRNTGGSPIPPHTYRSFAETLLDQWMDSPGHRQNILAPEAESLGAGCIEHRNPGKEMDKFYCVQVFTAGMDS